MGNTFSTQFYKITGTSDKKSEPETNHLGSSYRLTPWWPRKLFSSVAWEESLLSTVHRKGAFNISAPRYPFSMTTRTLCKQTRGTGHLFQFCSTERMLTKYSVLISASLGKLLAAVVMFPYRTRSDILKLRGLIPDDLRCTTGRPAWMPCTKKSHISIETYVHSERIVAHVPAKAYRR